MSAEHSDLERVRASYEAFERGDREGALAHVHPEIEWHQAQGLPHGGVYHGLDEVRLHVFDPLDREWWQEFSAAPEELVAVDDIVLVLGRYRGVARDTGRRLDVPFARVWTFSGGRAIRFRQFLDTAGWNERRSQLAGMLSGGEQQMVAMGRGEVCLAPARLGSRL